MEVKEDRLLLSGKGLVVVPPQGGMPGMRRLVEIYTDLDNRKYIKLDRQFTPLTSSHMLL